MKLSFGNNSVGSNMGPPSSAASSFELPVRHRRVRDSSALLFMLAFLSFLAYIIWDGVYVKEADINLIVHGHDSFGNICGRNNKPIKFADRSGQNYTDKPYTKYTLVNSQFERYTLDTSRAKHGELIYVKEAPSSDLDLQLAQAATRTPRVSRLFNGTTGGGGALNQLRFPSSYYYSSNHPAPPPSRAQTAPPPASRARPADLAGAAAAASEVATRPGAPATPGPATWAPWATRAAGQLVHSVVPAATANPSEAANGNNDSDRYDHMLVTPISVFTLNSQRPPPPPSDLAARPTLRHGINQNEAANQLLYLTECVSGCPSDHIELVFYRCMPSNWRFSLFPNAINVTRTFVDDILQDVGHCYRELIYTFSLAFVLSLGLLILLRFLAGIIIWSCILLLISIFVSMAGYAWLTFYYQIMDLNYMPAHDSIFSEKLANSDRWLLGSIFLTFIAFAAIGTVLFMRKRILLVTMLFRESGKAIADMPLLLLQPLLTFAALCAITAAWTIGLICLQSVKVPSVDMQTGFVLFKAETLYKVMKWYHIFAFLWASHFAIACQHYVIGASVSKWYFSSNRYALSSPIGTSVSELILYYLGSVALGSFLVAVFKVVRILTRQIQFVVQRSCMSPSAPNGTNQSINELPNQTSSSACGSCGYVWRLFIWFFDNIVMIINRDAYVEVAIHGHSFLAGARRAFSVLASNPLRLLAIKSVGNILLVVAKVCVVVGTVSMAHVLLQEKQAQLNYSWSPMVISALYAYIVAHWFLSVYEMVIDALFICYCEDYEHAKSLDSGQQPINGSQFMTQILKSGQIY